MQEHYSEGALASRSAFSNCQKLTSTSRRCSPEIWLLVCSELLVEHTCQGQGTTAWTVLTLCVLCARCRQPRAAMWLGAEEGYIDAGAALDDLELPSFEALLGDSLLDEAGQILPQELMLGPGCSAAGQANSGQEGSNQPGPGLRHSDSDSEGDAHSMLALWAGAHGTTQQAQAQHVPFPSRQPLREQTHSDDSQTGTATPMESSVGQVQSGVLQSRCKELDRHNQLLMGEYAGGAYQGVQAKASSC